MQAGVDTKAYFWLYANAVSRCWDISGISLPLNFAWQRFDWQAGYE